MEKIANVLERVIERKKELDKLIEDNKHLLAEEIEFKIRSLVEKNR